jgi:hypothetical protein
MSDASGAGSLGQPTSQHARQRIQHVGPVQPQVGERDDARVRVPRLPLRRRRRRRAPQRLAAEEVQALRGSAPPSAPRRASAGRRAVGVAD